MLEGRPTLLWSIVQHGSRRDQLLENLITLFPIGLSVTLFLLAEGFQERGDFGLNGGGAFAFAQCVKVLGELVGEFAKGALDEEGSSWCGHSDEGL